MHTCIGDTSKNCHFIDSNGLTVKKEEEEENEKRSDTKFYSVNRLGRHEILHRIKCI